MDPLSSPASVTPAARLAGDAAAIGRPVGARAARKSDDVSRAAGQFEAIILRQLLTPTIEPLMSGGLGGAGGSGGGVYGYMLTDVLATSLGAAGGLGLAKMLTQQLTPRGAPGEETAGSTREAAGPQL
jgi:peptidoglycan hydrolase FlgJ